MKGKSQKQNQNEETDTLTDFLKREIKVKVWQIGLILLTGIFLGLMFK